MQSQPDPGSSFPPTTALHHRTGLPSLLGSSDDDRARARAIVDDGIARYFASRRERVAPFVDKHFSLRGSLRLHRAAVGWDLARAPLNLAMAAPQIGLLAAAAVARRVGAHRTAATLGGKNLTVHTAVSREITWLIHTELLELPYEEPGRRSDRDALAEVILSDPRVAGELRPLMTALGASGTDPALRDRLDRALTEYARTRGAAAEVATAILSMSAGAATVGKLTPGVLTLGPTLAAAITRHASLVSFPAKSLIGTVWLRLFPAAAPSALLVTGLTGMLLAASTAAAAFSGVVTDPVQRQLGLHQRRLHRLIGSLEDGMGNPAAPGFAINDHYVARLLDLFDLAGAIYRMSAR